MLLGSRQTKLDAALLEKLLEHAGSAQLVRLASAGRNALDFTHKINEDEALDVIEDLSQAVHLPIGEKGTVTYHLEPK